MTILQFFLSEIEPFFYRLTLKHLDTLGKETFVNVLNKKAMDYICREFNNSCDADENSSGGSSCEYDCPSCRKRHPFCQLFNVGLIGYLHKSKDLRQDHLWSIRFEPYEGGRAIEEVRHLLPPSEWYFLHPALANMIERKRESIPKNFTHGNIIIGNRRDIEPSLIDSDNAIAKAIDNEIVNVDEITQTSIESSNEIVNETLKPESVFISSTCHDLRDIRLAVKDVLEEKGCTVLLSESIDFNPYTDGLHAHDHCINEMSKCNKLIFIIGKRYGSEYMGTKYGKYAKEITALPPEIEKPSVSLMEYYVAKKSGIKVIVYVDYDICSERNTFKSQINKDLLPPLQIDDMEVYDIIDFIEKQRIDNWICKYHDVNDLKDHVRKHC
jgi:hypothetical protein